MQVGWVLCDDASHCLVCTKEFVANLVYKHSCKACGNVVCAKCCAPEKAVVAELRAFGAVTVCMQCCWGQDEVQAVAYPAQPSSGSSSDSADIMTTR